jgi:hypothetical protein
MGQNASERGTRNVLNSRLGDFEGYRLAVDCGAPECGGERVYSVADLARLYGARTLMGRAVVRLRCRSCGGPPVACAIETGPQLAARGRMRRMALIGPESSDHPHSAHTELYAELSRHRHGVENGVVGDPLRLHSLLRRKHERQGHC